MSTLNHSRIAAQFGHSGDYLQTLLADPRQTTASIAAIFGTTPAYLARVLAQPTLYRLPLNWVSEAVVGSAYPYLNSPFDGAIAQVYAGPSDPGFTYGPPVYAPDTPHPILSLND